MSRIIIPTKDELLTLLRRLDSRVAAVERRNLATFNLVGPSPAMSGFATNTAYGNSTVDRAFSHLLVANASRLAYMFDHHSTGGLTSEFRLVAVNNANPYQASLPAWQVLAVHQVTSGSYIFRSDNIALPQQVRDGKQWNFSVHGRIIGGNGTSDQWVVRSWAVILTDDPDFMPERGD